MRSEQPIRILRVIARLNVGGPSLHVSHLTAELDRIGYETTLAAGKVGEGEGSMEYVAEQLGVAPLFVPALQREVAAAADAAAVRRLLAIIREFRPDVLHTHTAKAGAVGRAAAVLAGRDRPSVVVHTYHGHVLRGYFGARMSGFFRQVERRFARVSDALVAVSPEVRDDLVKLGVAPAEKIAVIRLGLDLDGRTIATPAIARAARDELGIPPEAFLIGWLGRMTEIKRADVLLRSFALLRERRDDAWLALVGDGPLRPGLERLADDLGVRDRCVFTGYRAEVAPVLGALDCVALTSANEGTPVTLIEAAAAVRPVVATDVGGVRDVVRDGESGFLVEPGDVEQLADRFERLAEDPALRRRFGAAGRDFVHDRYSVSRLVRDVDLLYRSLLDQHAPRSRRVLDARAVPLVPALEPHERPKVARPPRRRLNVVLVSQYFPPEIGATQSRAQSFAEFLAARGHRVTVICEFPNHPIGVFPERYAGRIVEDDRSNEYRILRVWVRATPQKTQMTRMTFYLSFMGLAAAVAPKAGRADVVVATSPPLFTGAAGLAIARMSLAPFVLDVRDLWPAAALSLDQISPGPTLQAAEALERWLYRGAAAVTAVTAPFCEHVDAIRLRPPKTTFIPNGTLGLFFDTPPSSDGNGRYRVTFAGTHGIAQALPSVIDAAAEVGDTAEFTLIGDGPVKPALVADVAERGLRNVEFHPQVPLEQIVPHLDRSDALLVPLSGNPTFADFVPSKMIDFMAAGRPVIVSAAGEAARILEHARAGVVVAPEDPAALARAVRWLADHPDEAAKMGERGRTFAATRMRGVQAERLEHLLLDVVDRRR